MKRRLYCSWLVVAASFLLLSRMLWGQDRASADNPVLGPIASMSSNAESPTSDGWIWIPWEKETEKARASQPSFVPPFAMSNVMLAQVVRYDMCWQQSSSGDTTANYGCSRGLEVVPTTRLEFGIYPPGYIVHRANFADGFGDLSYSVKFRAFSRPVGKGGYFVGFFLGGLIPTSANSNGTGHAVLTPTFAAAKVLGPFDIQSTIGGTLPTSGTKSLGRTLPFNTSFDYRIKEKAWLILEQDSTFWIDGPLTGNKQAFLTPGIVWQGKLGQKQKVEIGFGEQIAVTHFHQYNHRSVFTIRFPF